MDTTTPSRSAAARTTPSATWTSTSAAANPRRGHLQQRSRRAAPEAARPPARTQEAEAGTRSDREGNFRPRHAQRQQKQSAEQQREPAASAAATSRPTGTAAPSRDRAIRFFPPSSPRFPSSSRGLKRRPPDPSSGAGSLQDHDIPDSRRPSSHRCPDAILGTDGMRTGYPAHTTDNRHMQPQVVICSD